MTYKEFKSKYNGKYVDYDGAYGSQCWDLGQKYFIEVLGLPASVLSGCGLVSNMLKGNKYKLMLKYFDVVDIDKMQAGDVGIWEYGHIAIFDYYGPQTNNKYWFSQNPNAPKVMKINTGGLHAFRLKSTRVGEPVVKDDKVDQIEVIANELNVRNKPSTTATRLGYANKGYYNFISTSKDNGYDWYEIESNKWIASKEGSWTKLHLIKKEEVEEIEIEEPSVDDIEDDNIEIPVESNEPIEETKDEVIDEIPKDDYVDNKDSNNPLLHIINLIIEFIKSMFKK